MKHNSLEQIRCLVWDLDNTMWAGTLMESDGCRLRSGIRSILQELDRRGILLSIASANDPEVAFPLLRKKRIEGLFLHPQIGWGNKVSSIRAISKRLDLSLDKIGFIDDEPFELEQVQRLLPAVRVYPAEGYKHLLERPEFHPEIVTEESRTRRAKYQGAMERDVAADHLAMSHEQFLEFCRICLRIRRATPDDIPRIFELMKRTHQLNSTGVVLEPVEVESFLGDPRYRLYIAELADQFLDYGRIGVAVCRINGPKWELESFLLSCRVLRRGISGYFLSWLLGQAVREAASEFHGLYRPSELNQRMKSLYQLAGFRPLTTRDGLTIYSRNPVPEPPPPHWLTVEAED
jgi:FkbH-like protein